MSADLPPEYTPVLPPFQHQVEALRRSWRKRVFALFMEQGTGKTKIIIDTCIILYRKGAINALLVLAPNDVHEQWITEQFPLHWPKDLKLRTATWDAQRVRAQREVREVCTAILPGAFTVLAMNHDALATTKGQRAALAFLKKYKVLFALDESHDYKTPTAARTRAVLKLASLAPVRRIATGTPKTQSPFDFWSQFKFLDAAILGFDSFLTFKHRYAIWTKEHKLLPPDKQGRRKLLEYPVLQEYTRLEELNARMDPYRYCVQKKDCLDLPPKLPVTRLTHLSDAQHALYEELKEKGLLLLQQAEQGKAVRPLDLQALGHIDEESAEELLTQPASRVTTQIKLTLYLRLHQILGGFIIDDEKTTRLIDGEPMNCPRMKLTKEIVEEALASSDAKVIIWAVFRPELATLETLFKGAIRIDGSVTGAARSSAIATFKDPASPVRVLVAHQRTMGTGQNLTVAATSLYYSNGWSWAQRAQSEDRIHRIGQTGTVSIVDLKVRGGRHLDSRILAGLQGHADLAQQFMAYDSRKLKEVL